MTQSRDTVTAGRLRNLSSRIHRRPPTVRSIRHIYSFSYTIPRKGSLGYSLLPVVLVGRWRRYVCILWRCSLCFTICRQYWLAQGHRAPRIELLLIMELRLCSHDTTRMFPRSHKRVSITMPVLRENLHKYRRGDSVMEIERAQGQGKALSQGSPPRGTCQYHTVMYLR